MGGDTIPISMSRVWREADARGGGGMAWIVGEVQLRVVLDMSSHGSVVCGDEKEGEVRETDQSILGGSCLC